MIIIANANTFKDQKILPPPRICNKSLLCGKCFFSIKFELLNFYSGDETFEFDNEYIGRNFKTCSICFNDNIKTSHTLPLKTAIICCSSKNSDLAKSPVCTRDCRKVIDSF